MFAILPDTKARKLCLEMIAHFEESGFIDYDGERKIPTESLLEPSQGQMFGILVCYDGTVLKAFSGLLGRKINVAPFVPAVFDEDEFNRIEEVYDGEIHRLSAEIEKSPAPSLIGQRKALSEECWNHISRIYRFHCFDGKIRTLNEILPNAPSGTGDCCAIKLLSEAYRRNLRPAYLAEFFYGNGNLEHKSFHTPCDNKCKKLLPFIIGLDIVYQDQDIVVINKPAGLLSIPGKCPEKADCAASRVKSFFVHCIPQPCIHRLDMGTSGLLVLGLSAKAHDLLSRDFENRRIKKEYEALVEGKIMESAGTIDLPIRLDVGHRPYQIVDMEQGKKAVTDWEKIHIMPFEDRYVTRLRLIPHTGRTHQLRVHCASGLKHPIVGDELYGTPDAPRMMLMASYLEFTHPITGELMSFRLPREF